MSTSRGPNSYKNNSNNNTYIFPNIKHAITSTNKLYHGITVSVLNMVIYSTMYTTVQKLGVI